jgi:phosphate transport system substrate-binding protein
MEAAPLDPAGSAAALRFFDWVFRHGSNIATDLSYVPMPGSVVAAIERSWAKNMKTASGTPLFRP